MFNPVEFTLKIQQVAMQGAAASAKMMAANYMRLIEQQSHLLQSTFTERRHDDPRPQKKPKKTLTHNLRRKAARGKKSPCKGPDLLDHYGKRARDVDVEHI